jgi:hypothetical protein
MAALILLYWAQIPFSMAVSTLFKDSKVGNYVGSLLLIFPTLIFFNLISIKDDGKNWLYAFNWLPLIPGCSIMARLASASPDTFQTSSKIIDVDWISMPV